MQDYQTKARKFAGLETEPMTPRHVLTSKQIMDTTMGKVYAEQRKLFTAEAVRSHHFPSASGFEVAYQETLGND